MSAPTRNTKQRKVILEELTQVKTHPTAMELFDIVRRRLPRISLGTVYRNLDHLVAQGTVRKLTGGEGNTRYDADLHPHHHLRCAACQCVSDISLESDLLDESVLEQVDGLDPERILGLHLEIVGLCSDCGQKLSEEEKASLRRQWNRTWKGDE